MQLVISRLDKKSLVVRSLLYSKGTKIILIITRKTNSTDLYEVSEPDPVSYQFIGKCCPNRKTDAEAISLQEERPVTNLQIFEFR